MTHTPGPWSVDRLGVVTGGPHFLTSVAETYATKWAHCQATSANRHSQEAADYCGQMYEDAMANGRLIAAAPDLLEACTELFMQMRREGCGTQAMFERALAAINKAKGDDHA